jgi:hypothetical protein
MSTLIFGTSYIGDMDRQWLVRQWCHVNQTLNPDTHMAAFHSPSRIPFPSGTDVLVKEFPGNIGHAMQANGLDGWGRAFVEGLRYAARHGYTHVVHIETDLLFMHPVQWLLDQLGNHRAVSTIATPYPYIETALMGFRVDDYAWVDEVCAAYDWPNTIPHGALGSVPPEEKLRVVLGNDLRLVPIRGMRDEGTLLDASVSSLEYLTHSSRANYEKLMRSYGIEPI